MENNFFEIMSKQSDEQLINIVTEQRNDYREDAVVVAENILMQRGIAIKQPLRQPAKPKEIRNEINKRLAEGESIYSIKSDFRERNIEVPDIMDELAIKEKNVNKKNPILMYGFGIFGIIEIFLGHRMIGISLILLNFLGLAYIYMKNPPVSNDEFKSSEK